MIFTVNSRSHISDTSHVVQSREIEPAITPSGSPEEAGATPTKDCSIRAGDCCKAKGSLFNPSDLMVTMFNCTRCLVLLFSLLVLASDSAAGFIFISRTTAPKAITDQWKAAELHRLSSPTKLCMWSRDDDLNGADRFKACVPYFLPLLDGDEFGHYIYQRIPPLGFLNSIFIGPLAETYHKIPFLGVGLFILLTLGTRFNTDMDRNVRFNAQQAALIDVALIFPELIASGFVENPVPRYISEPCANFVWYVYMATVVYCVVSNLRGKKPDQVPYISNSADMMVGPF